MARQCRTSSIATYPRMISTAYSASCVRVIMIIRNNYFCWAGTFIASSTSALCRQEWTFKHGARQIAGRGALDREQNVSAALSGSDVAGGDLVFVGGEGRQDFGLLGFRD